MTVTPVLADQLEADGRGGAAARVPAPLPDRELRGRRRRRRAGAARRLPRPRRSATGRRSSGCEALDGDLARAVRRAGRGGPGRADRLRRHPRGAAAARDAAPAAGCSSTPACARTGGASARRPGFWLPECAYEPGLERAAGRARARLLLRRSERPRGPARRRWRRSRRPGGPVAFTIDWEAVSLAVVARRLSGRPAARRLSPQVAARRAAVGDRRRRLRPGARPRRAPASRRASSRPPWRRAWSASAAERGRPGLIVFAIDTELLGHWWWEGPAWLAELIAAAAEHGIELVTLGEARERHQPEARPLRRARAGARARTCAPGTRRRSPTWPGRRGGWSCACCARSPQGLEPAAAARAARELLAVQASDWAFLDRRRQAGDYPWQRATDHARSLLESIDSAVRLLAEPAPAEPGARPQPQPPARALASLPTTRVLILSWEYPPLIEGGLARHVRKLSESLARAGTEVHVLTRGGEESPEEETVRGVQHPPRPRADPADRPRRVRRLGRAHERRHARRRGRARRPLRLRPRPRPRLARGDGLRPPGAPLRRAAGDDDPRDRARPPPGLGRQAPPEPHPRGRALDHQPRRPRDRLLVLHARADRRHLRRRGGARRGDSRTGSTPTTCSPRTRPSCGGCAPSSPRRTSGSCC